MASIKINNLHTAGTELLTDSESYLNELTNDEIDMINGGFGFWWGDRWISFGAPAQPERANPTRRRFR